MKIRDLVFLIIGGLLVISGMVLNSVLVTDANADKGSIDTKFGKITCREIIIEDENGKNNKKKFYGLEATCLQHEIDHLNGKLFVDHISKLKRNRIFQKLLKHKKQRIKKS